MTVLEIAPDNAPAVASINARLSCPGSSIPLLHYTTTTCNNNPFYKINFSISFLPQLIPRKPKKKTTHVHNIYIQKVQVGNFSIKYLLGLRKIGKVVSISWIFSKKYMFHDDPLNITYPHTQSDQSRMGIWEQILHMKINLKKEKGKGTFEEETRNRERREPTLTISRSKIVRVIYVCICVLCVYTWMNFDAPILGSFLFILVNILNNGIQYH